MNDLNRILLILVVFVWVLSTPLWTQETPPSNEKSKKEKLKEKLVEEVLKAVEKEAEKRLRYDRRDVFVRGSVSSHRDIVSGTTGDYDDILVKDSNGVYRHLDGKPASADEIKKFKEKFSRERSIIPDFTVAKWNTRSDSNPTFSHKLFDTPYGGLNASGGDLHARFDVRTGKMTLTDDFGIVHEGVGVKASAIASLTVINLRGESKTVKFEKGDFSLKSKLVFALTAGPYASVSTTNIADLNGFYSHNTMEMGVRGNANLSLPTDVKYKRLNLRVTPYVSAGAYSNIRSGYDYTMGWGGGSAESWNIGRNSGANFEVGVTVSMTFDDIGKLTRGFVEKITGLGR
ncbi:MAG: hypothetical protein D6785_06780 [Planctomycetota bacterium]|nr:MAG: hypothetical protein D6785_06780 [Planctomycetota bacterium]